ncbi:uncharacterized protein [Physcomitrium patens]|uniref:Uncharacterized protein n=1 Tax=Physcomitrium patens TaxID=3218 RepID=A0A2K1IEP3_PHYPA|nr:uncharacterized protein LOC112277221 [Physcomitrium patens]XP_024365079.1 uncharacterized protein LOC112277221 [Physcomitrium patens]XP_024365080.1 uncharacterized protein LOC112277221 [Physcomitrium patens]PNR27744.1 hypothetical protein PHYPA_029896 [Physcomitrium patens]|eukprot:XP_024365078.1 uncharacterized protein LOC112277221 [Physcomitrella patens]
MSPFSSNECDASWPSTSSKEHEESTSPNSKGKGKKSSLSPDSDKEIEVSNKLTVPEVSSLSLTDSQQSLERGSSSSSIFSDINGLSTENVENDYLDSDSLDSDSLNSDLLNSESFNNTQVSGTPVTASILTGAVSQYETDSFARNDEVEHLNLELDANTENMQETTHDALDPNSIEVYIKTKPLRKFEDLSGTESGCIPGAIMGHFIGISGDIFDRSTWFNLNLDRTDSPLVSSRGITIPSFDMGSGELRSQQALMISGRLNLWTLRKLSTKSYIYIHTYCLRHLLFCSTRLLLVTITFTLFLER